MAQQGMFGNQYQQAVTDETALRRQQAQTGGMTGWAAITNAMSGIGSEIGYQGGQAIGGQTAAQVQQSNFQSVMDSVPDFDAMDPESLQKMSSAMWQGGFYDEGMQMMNQSRTIQKDDALIKLYEAQAADELEVTPVSKTTNRKDYLTLQASGEFTGTYLEYLDRNVKESSDLTTDEKHFKKLSEDENYTLSFQEFLDNKANGGMTNKQKEYAAEKKAKSFEGTFGEWLDMDAMRGKTDTPDKFVSYTPTQGDADTIDSVLDENYDFGAFDFDLWGLGDKAGSMSAVDGVEVLRQKVFNIYKNSDKLFGQVLTFDEIIEKYPNPADLMAVKIGGSGVSNGSDEEVLLKKINAAN